MANLDIAERRLAQDGRIKLQYDQRDVDVRVSIVPALFGEKAALRILDPGAMTFDLSALGFDDTCYARLHDALNQPHGMILVTGPTGSGKTTTVYAALRFVNSTELHIMTAEDPIEYRI